MRNILVLSICLVFGLLSQAQSNNISDIANQISTKELKSNLYALASDAMQGRLMGSHGDTLASQFVAEKFKSYAVEPAYRKNGLYQKIITYKKQVKQAELTIGNKTFKQYEGWYYPLRAAEPIKFKNLEIVFAGYGIAENQYNDFANVDVKGKAVLLITGQPRQSNGTYYLTGTAKPADVKPYQTILRAKGARLILLYNPNFNRDTALIRNATQGDYKNKYAVNNNLPVINLNEILANELLLSAQITIKQLGQNINTTGKPASFLINNKLNATIKIDLQKGHAPNVIGMIKGSNPNAGYVIISAHHDHNGMKGDSIYYGAVDNASGTAALIETARLMKLAANQGMHPKRTIILASYTGEERGLLGSYYFAANPLLPLSKAWAVFNIDMMGRVDTLHSGKKVDSNYAYILVKDSLNRSLRQAITDGNKHVGLTLDSYYEQPQYTYRRVTGSDHYPFYLKGIPILRIDCGFSKNYHQLSDTPDKINYDLLTKQVKLAFLTTWNIANN